MTFLIGKIKYMKIIDRRENGTVLLSVSYVKSEVV